MATIKEQFVYEDFDFSARSYEAECIKEEQAIERYKQQLQGKQKGKLVGEEISFPVADGRARYVVMREKPLQLAHLAVGDAWQVSHILIRGLRVKDIADMLETNKRIDALFAKA